MRDLPPAFAARLAEPATTLCRCWRLVRRDGIVLGFTDHDRDLSFDGTVFAAGTGLEAADAAAELGFAIGGGDVAGALSSGGIAEADIAAGLYDDATVEAWQVDWSDPSARLALGTASIGEIRRRDGAFVAELRGPAHRMDEEHGRVFRADCAADLGDGRCRANLDGPGFRAEATVVETDGSLALACDGLGGVPDGRFTGGRLLWTSGANAGLAVEVAAHRSRAGRAFLDLWQRASVPIVPGDAFRVTAGCDKRLATCRDVFANAANFRGFPHMPGNDFVVAAVRAGAGTFDGGSLFR